MLDTNIAHQMVSVIIDDDDDDDDSTKESVIYSNISLTERFDFFQQRSTLML